MAKRIARNFTDQLLEKADIVSVINPKVTLKKSGKNYQGCCPFHNEKTPSFSVSQEKGLYYCFGCGAKGNAISFLMDHDHLSFVESVERLAEITGVSVEYDNNFDQKKVEKRKSLYDLLDKTCGLYERQLIDFSGQQAREYLLKRQVDQKLVNFFRLGFSKSDSQLSKVFDGDYSEEDLSKVALSKKGDYGHYDVFRDRLMFPIRDARGRVVGFGARALNDEIKPKYLNSPESELFVKRHVLYGLYELLQLEREVERLIFVEGYMDVIALHQSGINGAVATLGTALTAEHITLAKRYCKKMVICFDGDNAGKRAAQRAIETILPVMELGMEVKLVFLPDGEDPDTLVKKVGKSDFYRLLDEGSLLSEVLFDSLIADSDMAFVEGKGEVADRAKQLFNQLPETEYRTMLYQDFTQRLDMDFLNLFQSTKTPQSNRSYPTLSENKVSVSHNSMNAASRLIRLLLNYPEFAFNARHLNILSLKEDDSYLLMLLIKHLQLHSAYINRLSFSDIQSHFSKQHQDRLGEILNRQNIEKIGVQIEEEQIKRKIEFISGLEKLINRHYREIFFKAS